MDFVESPKSQWMGRYNWGDENQVTQGLGLAGTKVLTNYEQYTGSNTRTFTPTLVNEVRFGYTRFFNSLGTLSQPAPWMWFLISASPTRTPVIRSLGGFVRSIQRNRVHRDRRC